jgi:hypothetical protein
MTPPFFFGPMFILVYKPEAKSSRNYEPLHLKETYSNQRQPQISPSPHHQGKVKRGEASVSVLPLIVIARDFNVPRRIDRM